MSKLNEMKTLLSRPNNRGSFDLPDSGRITLSEIGEVVGGISPGGRVSIAAMRDKAGFPAGKVSMSDFYGYDPFPTTHTMVIGDDTVLSRRGFVADFLVGSMTPIQMRTTTGQTFDCASFYARYSNLPYPKTVYLGAEKALGFGVSVKFNVQGQGGENLGPITFNFAGGAISDTENEPLANYFRNNVGKTVKLQNVY